MAIFNAINKRSGLVVGTIIVALALFILTEFFFGQNSVFKSSSNSIGEISGQSIPGELYQRKLSQAESNHMMRTNMPVTENDRPMIQENAWNQLIFDIAYKEEFKELGILITEDEWLEMAQGDFIHPMVRQLFGNPEDFNKEMVRNFLRNLNQYPAQDQALWNYVDSNLPEVRIREKYLNLFKKSTYITKAEARREHAQQNQKADLKFLNIPLYTISDSSIAVTDAELNDHIRKHKDDYKVEEGRSLDYVIFSIEPSADDTLQLTQEMMALANDFANTDNDSLFVQYNSERPVDITYLRMGDLADEIQALGSQIEFNKVYGPFIHEGDLKLYKIMGTKSDTVFSARASHILFKPTSQSDNDKAQAKKEAQQVLARIQAGESFEEMAKQFGTDGTAPNGGDLGWFTEGMMVAPFNDAVFNATQKGLLTKLVETQFGFHIIKITEPKVKKQYKVAELNKRLDFTEETKDRMYQKASMFLNNLKDSSDFYKKVKADNSLVLHSSQNISKNERNLNNLVNARDIVKWAYNKAEVGEISPVIPVGDKFVVAVLTKKREKGLAELKDVREDVTAKVRQKKKAEQVIQKLAQYNGSLEEIAKQYGPDATVGNAEGVAANSNYIQGIGYDPIAVGRIFGLDPGQKSKPFEGQSSVVMLELVDLKKAPEIADYTNYKNQLRQQRGNRDENLINEAIKEAADIKDSRYKFF